MRLSPHITEEVFNKFEKSFLYMALANVKHVFTSTTRFDPNWAPIIEETMGIDVSNLGLDHEDFLDIVECINNTLSSIQVEMVRQEYL